jgi:type III secretory pathway component EscT
MTQWENESIIAMALTHFPALVIFSFLVSVVFGVLAKEAPRERLVYAAKVFGAFVGTALVLGWLMYFFPR